VIAMPVFANRSGLDSSGAFGAKSLGVEDVPEFEVSLVHIDGCARVRLRGDLDFAATTRHAGELAAVADLRTEVVLDVAGVEFVDSSGLRFLVDLAKRYDRPVRLEGVQEPVRRLLEITGLDALLDIGR
jgi:anti-sigma B factor antagonist